MLQEILESIVMYCLYMKSMLLISILLLLYNTLRVTMWKAFRYNSYGPCGDPCGAQPDEALFDFDHRPVPSHTRPKFGTSSFHSREEADISYLGPPNQVF